MASKATLTPTDSRLTGSHRADPTVVVSTLHRRFGLRVEERQHLAKKLVKLTPREREVAYSVFMGGDNETLSSRLCIAMPTLRTHLMRINQKLGTTSKGDIVQFVAMALLDGYRNGTITAGSP